MKPSSSERFATKRQEILAAAGHCFARLGFQGASISAICAEAKISPGHLYHYFESKDAMIAAIIDDGLSNARSRFDWVAAQEDFIGALIEEIARSKPRDRKTWSPDSDLPLQVMSEARRNPAIARLLALHSGKIRHLLIDLLQNAQVRGQIDQSLNPDIAASVILSVIDGVDTITLRDPTIDFDAGLRMLQLMIERFLRAPGRGLITR